MNNNSNNNNNHNNNNDVTRRKKRFARNVNSNVRTFLDNINFITTADVDNDGGHWWIQRQTTKTSNVNANSNNNNSKNSIIQNNNNSIAGKNVSDYNYNNNAILSEFFRNSSNVTNGTSKSKYIKDSTSRQDYRNHFLDPSIVERCLRENEMSTPGIICSDESEKLLNVSCVTTILKQNAKQ
ncbi:hypothetical protein HELRODRAFT_170436 [Helobdella robusta]|uniref:Uncharacterized protein n=1 Tax=Helobdella robusta TaxID=6412 RepID=T1F323_HELRO|nr:hypothetical protein HELRODRAFT_170436 [Helobdella robusta]ESO07134.1 hypothetical protein HELRODRAFT_170436 [Helobdella robusta]